MTEPFVLEPCVMKSVGDCGICCLKMLLGVSYDAVFGALSAKARKVVMADGAEVIQYCNAARKLGFELTYHDEDYDPDRIGILVLDRTVNEDRHMVVWLGQALYNPADGLIYADLETYLVKAHYRIEGFLFISRRIV